MRSHNRDSLRKPMASHFLLILVTIGRTIYPTEREVSDSAFLFPGVPECVMPAATMWSSER